MNKERSYNDIFKSTTLMGSVQIILILLRIIRMKVVSVILGTAGMGINALFMNSISLISSITSLGLNLSSVKEISASRGDGDKLKLSRTVKSLRHWVWISGLLGSVIMLTLAPLLSRWTFDSDEYTWSFAWLSCVMLLKAIAEGENSIMRGMQKLRSMAKASALGATIGLIVSLPLYYLFGIKGIVPALILSAIVTLFTEKHFSRKIEFEKVTMSRDELFREGVPMARLGIMLVLSSFIGTLTVYLTNIFITHFGSIEELGLYQAGVNLSNQYVGMVFTAMATDYFPRLSIISNDNREVRDLANKQSEIAILIIAPIAIGIILSAPIAIKLLYTSEFMPIVGYLQWISLGVLFKACSWAMAYIILAKGESKLFFYTELLSHTIILSLTILGYHLGGVTGTGIAFLVSYIIYTTIIYVTIHKRYSFSFDKEYIRIFIVSILLVASSLAITLHLDYPKAYVSSALLFLISAIFSLRELNKRISLKDFFKRR